MVVDDEKNNEKCLKEWSSKDEEMELGSSEEGNESERNVGREGRMKFVRKKLSNLYWHKKKKNTKEIEMELDLTEKRNH